MQPYNNTQQEGFVLIIAMIVVGSIIAIMLVSNVLVGISNVQQADTYSNGLQARYSAEACVDEALLNLVRDEEYVGGADITIGDAVCDITVTESAGEYTVQVIAVVADTYQYDFEVVITRDPLEVLSWQ